MPRIHWEEAVGTVIDSADRSEAGTHLRYTVAAIISKYDTTYLLDPLEDTVFDPSIRSIDAKGDKDVIVSVSALDKPLRREHTTEIGDEIWEAIDPYMKSIRVTWSLSIRWDEHYYRNE